MSVSIVSAYDRYEGSRTRSRVEERIRGTTHPLAARRATRHGYELSKLIHTRSGGQLTFHIDSLYPLLYRLEERGWIKGTWVEKPNERRRRLLCLSVTRYMLRRLRLRPFFREPPLVCAVVLSLLHSFRFLVRSRASLSWGSR
jgi:Transcriptional regulator PadR-like family